MANEDRQYQTWLRTRPCSWCGVWDRSIVHHHTARRAKGRRAHDHDGMPLCPGCHIQFHGACGPFKDMKRDERRDWQDRMVDRYRAQYGALLQQEDDECETEMF